MNKNKKPNTIKKRSPQATLQTPKELQKNENLRQQADPVKLSKIKPILRYQAEWRCKSLSDIAYINKCKPKMLSKVQLTHIFFNDIGDIGIRKLQKALIDNKKTQFLVFTKSQWQDPYAEHLHHLLYFNNHLKGIKLAYDSFDGKVISKEAVKRLTRLQRCRDLSCLYIDFYCLKQTKDRILECLSKQLRALPKLKALNLDAQNCDNLAREQEFDHSFDETFSPEEYDTDDTNACLFKLKLPGGLKSLHLNFGEGKKTIHLLSRFASTVQQCRWLEDLKLDLDFDGKSQNVELWEARVWTSLFEKTQNLKNLTITKSICTSQELEGTQVFLESLLFLKSLRRLNLNLNLAFEKEGIGFSDAVSQSLALIPSLKSLNLNVSSLEKQPDMLFKTLQSFIHLEKLRLNLTKCTLKNTKVLEGIAYLISHLSQLKDLKLLLPPINLSKDGAVSFSQSLRQLAHLKILSLHFQISNPDYEFVEILSNGISQIGLTSFEFILNAPNKSLQASKKGLTPLFSALAGLTQLTILNLKLSAFGLSTKETIDFSRSLQELKQLSSLTLDLLQFNTANKCEALQGFAANLKKIRHLSSLHLTFGKSVSDRSVSDEEIKYLASGLGNCRKLESLSLSFKHAEKLTGAFAQYLTLGLGHLSLLKSFNLEFANGGIPMKAAIGLVEGLTVVKSLEKLNLGITFSTIGCDFQLNDVRILENLKHLVEFVFNGYRVY